MTDYERVERAIAYIQTHFRYQPGLEDIAAQVHLSPYHFQRLFSRWAGVTPKRFLQALTLSAAKAELRSNLASILDISQELGLSSGSRLHDHFVKIEAMTPEEYRRGGESLTISYGLAGSPFGDSWIARTERGICALWFRDMLAERDFLDDMTKRWPLANFLRDDSVANGLARNIFNLKGRRDRPLSLLVRGTNFQVNVWNALLRIPPGSLASYAEVAGAVGSPNALRAVGSAVGANPVAFLIPCHRVIRQDGGLGGYRGGLLRKGAMLTWEAMRSGA